MTPPPIPSSLRPTLGAGSLTRCAAMRQVLVALGLAAAFSAGAPQAEAQATVPEHAAGLLEQAVTVPLDGSATQTGVLSRRRGFEAPTHLAVLLPGHPSVVRPVMGEGFMASSSLSGNFLIRARRHLADDRIATLIADCRSDSSIPCSAAYQASPQRQQDIQRLIDEVRRQLPSIESVWLVGTSMGTISSAYMAMHAPDAYAGAIHTAGITEPYAFGSYVEMTRINLRRVGRAAHFIVHHQHDPCRLTTWIGAQRWSREFDVPLLTVTGGSGFTGHPCMAHTEHGFKGREFDVMRAMARIITTGRLEQTSL